MLIPMLDKSIAIREGEEAYNKSKNLLNIAKEAIEIAVEKNEKEAGDFIDIELQK